MGKSLQTKQIANEVLWIVVGCLLYSLSVVWFIDPAQIIPGSVTGIAVVTKALFGIPIGVLNLVVNIPLVLIGMFYLGKKLLVYTALTVFLNSVLMDQLAKVLQPMTQDIFPAVQQWWGGSWCGNTPISPSAIFSWQAISSSLRWGPSC